MTHGGFQTALDPKLDLALVQTEMRVGRERGMERSDDRSLAGRSRGVSFSVVFGVNGRFQQEKQRETEVVVEDGSGKRGKVMEKKL
ncbi:hypothetical protein HAX54_035623, partial [Datura stramonium]|nr:hypothetical protein [Datura stramonium]